MSPVIEVARGAVTLAGRPILRDIDLTVESGEVVALLGANGSGKSTLVKAIVGLLPMSSGHARLFGTPLTEFTDWRRLGYVPQRSTITQGVPATVREVVSAGRLARRPALRPPNREDRRAVQDALEAVGLADRASHQVATLSGGQQQRVLMARTLAGAPELLVLDEPNAGVDLISQHAIADTLADRARAGSTIVVVLHELGPFEPLIRRTVVMREGRITYDGSPTSLEAVGHGDHCDPVERPLRVPPMSGLLEEER
ncbi:MAG TPA: metal ABC transporter ATP-binding protein [Marmoricola sp.]|jgi:zinc transport system ATP-binding protein|nr:metal ABC transporter ATP-binding protein [Marmoricola sp.]